MNIWDAMTEHSDPKKLRQRADEADARAKAAERDHDVADAVQWREKALRFRRKARDIEFAV